VSTLLAIGLILFGLAYPLAVLVRLNRTLSQASRPPSTLYLSTQLVLTAALPVSTILTGAGLLVPRLWANGPFVMLVIAAWVMTAASFVLLGLLRWRGRGVQ
jgi:hypothetical protein